MDVLAGLDDAQRAAAQATGPVVILAGAGAGKTRTITHRIAHQVATGHVAGSHVMAVTFTTRAAGELRARLARLGADGVVARTFHAAALRQLTYFWPRLSDAPPPVVLEAKLPVVADAARRRRVQLSRDELRDVTSEIEWAKARVLVPDAYPAAARAAGRTPPVDLDVLADIYTSYQDALITSGQVDFDDLLLATAVALETNPSIAQQVRDQYRSFTVDEYQDVSPLQQRLLDAWLGGRDEVCVVGDPRQTIYSFSGADPRLLATFTDRHPQAQVVRLTRDYRSTPQIVDVAVRLVGGRPGDLVGVAPPGDEPEFVEYPDEVSEAAGTASRIAALVASGTDPTSIAVLYRIGSQSEPYEEALAAVGVPVVLRGSQRFFDRPEVIGALRLLRAASRGDAGAPLGESVRSILAGLGLTEQPPAGAGAVRERWSNLAALAELADELAEREAGADLARFVDDLAERATAQHAPVGSGVTLSTMHAAKGLEWDCVFVVGLTDSMVPIVHATRPEQIEEERRLLYVAATRARRSLTLSWSLARTPGARRGRNPSRFLDGVRPSPPPPPRNGGGRSTAPASTGCSVCSAPLAKGAERALGRCAGCASDGSLALFEQLRTWRAGVAAELGQPAYVVFTDATLGEIALTRPAGRSALSRVKGVGAGKLDRFGDDVLAVVHG